MLNSVKISSAVPFDLYSPQMYSLVSWLELRPAQNDVVKPSPTMPENRTLFGNRDLQMELIKVRSY